MPLLGLNVPITAIQAFFAFRPHASQTNSWNRYIEVTEVTGILGILKLHKPYPIGGEQVFTLTCRNHTGARYLTKGAFRNLHFVEADPVMVRAWYSNHFPDRTVTDEMVENLRHLPTPSMECPCSATDLVEVSAS